MITSASQDKKDTIAIFDLDGTITSKDTFIAFIKYVNGKLKYYLGILYLSPYIVLFYLKLYTNRELKEMFFSYYTNYKLKQALKVLL